MKIMRILCVSALEQERFDLPESCAADWLLTGIGKSNATYALTRYLCEHPGACDLVMNVGTAGTQHYQVGDILFCNRFIDRDLMRLQHFGVAYRIATSYTRVWPSVIGGVRVEKEHSVSTGDDFVTASDNVVADAIDMEAYALAVVCGRMGLPFVSVKYITDVVGQNSVAHWEDRLADARKGLTVYFKDWSTDGFGKY